MKKEFRDILDAKGWIDPPAILLVASECAPLAKTGGLADVVGTLPKVLKDLGLDARVMIPYHRIIKDRYRDQAEHMMHFYSEVGWKHCYVGVEKLVLDGMVVYLIDNEDYFGDRIYRGGQAELDQYAFFQRAVMDAIPALDFRPSVIHCNDWQAGMLPFLGKTQYRGGMQEGLRYLLTIHNIAYQGRWNFPYMQELLRIPNYFNTPEFIELYGEANMLKAGCVFADRINTVSPSYAEEIKTPYFGEGLQGILMARSHELSGIINGIDKQVFDPETDPLIPEHYNKDDRSGKAKDKAALQMRLGLEVSADTPLFAMVTRMTEQKGFDLVAAVIDDMMANNDMQFVLLGTGDAWFEDGMRAAEQRWKGRLCSFIGYDADLANLIYAGSDFYLMPSRFEPCGISQMIAMRYGSIPIVHETGGLRDTVQPYNQFTGEGTGFSFANYDPQELRQAMWDALKAYRDPAVMDGLIDRAMAADFGFAQSAEEYAKLYLWML